MSELIAGREHIPEGLMTFARSIMTGSDVREIIRLERPAIDSVTPYQAMVVLDSLLDEGFSVAEVKNGVGKILNMFHRGLSSFECDLPGEGHFLHYLMLENREAEARIALLRELTKKYFRVRREDNDRSLRKAEDQRQQTVGGSHLLKESNLPSPKAGGEPHTEVSGQTLTEDDNRLRIRMLEAVKSLEAYELHYIKKENILFPYIEKTFPSYGCLKVMWAFHDDFRKCIRTLTEMLSRPDPPREGLNRELGKLFFTVLPVIFREEKIVFPVALQAIPQEGWDEMLAQGSEAGWCYFNGPGTVKQKPKDTMPSELTDLVTGALSAEQIVLMMENLPVDITYVDENDIVRYFSGEKHRIFPRSKAIIGREVQNCHPPDSVEVVEQILQAFRSREKDHADFWINMRERFIHIRYFALYDTHGNYRGTIEVSQDVTEIRALEGEKRLLDWK